jgi:tryptophan synthase alpha chain
MPSRLTKKLAELKSKKEKAFAAYLMAGDPDWQTTENLILALEKNGATLIELGVPFSDPMADGPVIQLAAERALKNGVTLPKIFAFVKRLREKTQIPILLMGYFNPVLQFGLENFAKACCDSGVDAALIVDLPLEESQDLLTHFKKRDLDLIFLLTPTSTPARIKRLSLLNSGFIYYVSLTGVTGAATLNAKDVAQALAPIKKKVSLPILIGFGISTPEHVRALAPLADGVVVGSAFLKILEKTSPAEALTKISELTRDLSLALKL